MQWIKGNRNGPCYGCIDISTIGFCIYFSPLFSFFFATVSLSIYFTVLFRLANCVRLLLKSSGPDIIAVDLLSYVKVHQVNIVTKLMKNFQ